MQFKGSLRSPGDRGPGIRVSLEVDEYHLQIRRGTELMGRWYLADVEVVRDIAERFTLFLGDDEMEFLADDALVFAYDGVTRMQQGWMNAQKKKRRHRRAAAESARRKDSAPDDDAGPAAVEEERRQLTRAAAKAPNSELAKKLAAIAAAEDAELSYQSAERFPREKPAEPQEPAIEVDWIAAREEMAVGREEPGPLVEPARAEGRLKRREPAAAVPLPDLWVEIEPAPTQPEPLVPRAESPAPEPQWPEPQWPEPQWIEVTESVPWAEPAWLTPTEVRSTPAEEQEKWTEPTWMVPEGEQSTQAVPVAHNAQAESDLRLRFEALEHAARDEGFPDGRAETKPKKRRAKAEKAEKRELTTLDGADGQVQTEPEQRRIAPAPLDLKPVRTKPSEKAVEKPTDKPVELRNDGHHPIESNVGLLAKLRRAPKVADGHVHVYQESRSTVGLTRRVCVECSHVSISSDE